MSLIKELGIPYMMERFADCMFYGPGDVPSYIYSNDNWPRGKVRTIELRGESYTNPEIVHSTLPESFFKDLSVFHTPPLGWRMSEDGAYLAHFRRQNKSYQRALATKVIQRTVSPATSFLIDTENLDGYSFSTKESTISLIMRPRYLNFREGLERMRNGDLFSFSVNCNLAVIPDVDDQQALLFNTTNVGIVKSNGEVVCDIPQVHKLIQDSIK